MLQFSQEPPRPVKVYEGKSWRTRKAWLRAYWNITEINWAREAERIRDWQWNHYKEYLQSWLNRIYDQLKRAHKLKSKTDRNCKINDYILWVGTTLGQQVWDDSALSVD